LKISLLLLASLLASSAASPARMGEPTTGVPLEAREPRRADEGSLLLVRLLDTDGEVVRQRSRHFGSSFFRWPSEPEVTLEPIALDGRPARRSARDRDDGSCTFRIRGERDYRLTVRAPGQATRSELVRAPADGGTLERVVVLDRPRTMGTVSFRVTGPDGERFDAGLRMRVVDRACDAVVLDWHSEFGREQPIELELPKGSTSYWRRARTATSSSRTAGSRRTVARRCRAVDGVAWPRPSSRTAVVRWASS